MHVFKHIIRMGSITDTGNLQNKDICLAGKIDVHTKARMYHSPDTGNWQNKEIC